MNSTLPSTKRSQKTVIKKLDGFSLFTIISPAYLSLFSNFCSDPPRNNVAVLLYNWLGVFYHCVGGWAGIKNDKDHLSAQDEVSWIVITV